MGFILRHRSEPMPEDEAHMQSARQAIRRFHEALVRLVDRDSADDAVAGRRVAQLTLIASTCEEDIDEARWRYQCGDTLGAERYLTEVVARAEEGIRAIDDPALQH